MRLEILMNAEGMLAGQRVLTEGAPGARLIMGALPNGQDGGPGVVLAIETAQGLAIGQTSMAMFLAAADAFHKQYGPANAAQVRVRNRTFSGHRPVLDKQRPVPVVLIDGTPVVGEYDWGNDQLNARRLGKMILHSSTGDSVIADELYLRFTKEIVAKWGDTWSISLADVMDWVTTEATTET